MKTQIASLFLVRSFVANLALTLAVWIFLSLQLTRAVTFQFSNAEEFSKIIDTNSVLTTNATVSAWLEGPVWLPGTNSLVFCDQGNNRLRILVSPNTVTNFLLPSSNVLYNGTMLDAQERLIAAQAGPAGRRIVMITNGVVTPLVSTCNGLQFYSPNDVVVKSDGTIWFTDPGYNSGIVYANPPPTGFPNGYHVYRCNPTNGNASCVQVITNIGNVIRPNGLCFSPDETKLYVADSGSARAIRVYNVSSSNTVSGGTIFATIPVGVPDGIRCDVDGRVWSSGGDANMSVTDGVYIYAPAPNVHLIGSIRFYRTANLCFGGPQYKTLYMTGQPNVTSIPVKVAGMPSVKKLRQNLNGNQLELTWPAPSTGFVLQETEQLNSPVSWISNSFTPIVTNGQNWISVETTNPAKFFRLRLN